VGHYLDGALCPREAKVGVELADESPGSERTPEFVAYDQSGRCVRSPRRVVYRGLTPGRQTRQHEASASSPRPARRETSTVWIGAEKSSGAKSGHRKGRQGCPREDCATPCRPADGLWPGSAAGDSRCPPRLASIGRVVGGAGQGQFTGDGAIPMGPEVVAAFGLGRPDAAATSAPPGPSAAALGSVLPPTFPTPEETPSAVSNLN
jgi:hypothetical protein